MGWQAGSADGAGDCPDRDPWLPGGAPPAPDPRLAQFAFADNRAAPVPSGRLALLADELSGPERRCPERPMTSSSACCGLGGDRVVGRRGEAWRDRGAHPPRGPPTGGGYHGDLPDEWSPSLRHELAAALACSTQSAETTAWLAWEQRARLPGIGARLDDGTLTCRRPARSSRHSGT